MRRFRIALFLLFTSPAALRSVPASLQVLPTGTWFDSSSGAQLQILPKNTLKFRENGNALFDVYRLRTFATVRDEFWIDFIGKSLLNSHRLIFQYKNGRLILRIFKDGKLLRKMVFQSEKK